VSYRRIACLCAGAVETLYMLGAEEQIAGISGFTFHPSRARKEKPKVSGFRSAKIDRILAVEPDLAIAFSHVQHEIVRDLVQAGVEVHAYNHLDLAGILNMVRSLAALAGREDEGRLLLADLDARINASREKAARAKRRPRIFFEYMSEPLTTGIGWVSDLIDIAGGEDCFAEIAKNRSFRDRAVGGPAEVVKRAPDIILGNWRGRRIGPPQIAQRPGWDAIPAVRENRMIEIKTTDFHVPGPGVITRGLRRMTSIIEEWA
jgi:iron complex transport system substrate-binding protein